ncbi:hypothetical protein BGZ94_001029 [Podila epigama]|nr:hypothetical protein BGZ94_001029 [Podila epigama]
MSRLKAMFAPQAGHHHHHAAPVAATGPAVNPVSVVKRSLFRRTPRHHSHSRSVRRNPFVRRTRGMVQAAGVPVPGHHRRSRRSPLASLKAMFFRPRRATARPHYV